MQEHFKKLLKETMGLDAETIGSGAIAGAIHLRMTSLGFQFIEEYWERINASNEELQELIEIVVVPETWFFRDEDAFSALARVLANEGLSDPSARTIRLLSGPCCSGEEPYSMAMALLNAGFRPEQFHVDAVDISRRALSRAAVGVYGPNSFRSENVGFRDRYFERTPAGYRLSDSIRKLVNFHHGNLLAPNFCLNAAKYDVIFCRNVLIYFDSATQQRLLRTLGSLLTEKGVLFVGPAEAFLAGCNGFRSINESMSFAFRKTEPDMPQASLNLTPRNSSSVNRPASMPEQRARIFPPLLPSTPLILSGTNIEKIRDLADAGRLADAGKLCTEYLKEHGSSIPALYLQGLIGDALGDSTLSEECYRKVLYLEPAHNEAMTHLALLLERKGDKAGAQRLRNRARRTETVAAP